MEVDKHGIFLSKPKYLIDKNYSEIFSVQQSFLDGYFTYISSAGTLDLKTYKELTKNEHVYVIFNEKNICEKMHFYLDGEFTTWT